MGDTRAVSRPFAAGRFNFTVSTSTPEDRRLIEDLFADLPVPDPHDAASSQFTIRREEVPETRWRIEGPRLDVSTGLSWVSLTSLLLSAVNLSALDSEPESLHLHAAAASKDGEAVIIAAARNTGKTTTVAHLLQRGWAYITDETVRLPAHDDEISGFAKPLAIKPGGESLLGHFEAWMAPPISHEAASFRFVTVGATGTEIARTAVPRVVILLRRSEFDPPEEVAGGRRLEAADAVVSLMQETLDAERFGSAALRLGELVASARCYEVMIGSPSGTADLIEQIFDEGPADPVAVREMSAPGGAVSPGVSSISIDGRMVLHDHRSGRIVALDPSAAQVWEQIGGWQERGIDVNGPVVAPFVEQLRQLGFLRGPASDEPTARAEGDG